ncbi:MAG: peptidylprolyl isomerase [Candidatus Acidiferrum sp.]|jgi:peptidyl-prolyl cis-trans isomerase A (cyclophilin A)
MMKAAISSLAAILVLATATCPQTPATQAPATHKSATPSSAAAHTYDRALLHPALLKAPAPATYQVKFTTTKGDFTVTVTRAWAPLGADRFYNLVKHHFYDNATFFRVLNNPPFMAQFGVSAYPAVSAAWEKAEIKDDPVTQQNVRGFVSFATSGPNTRTTQVFINYGDNKRLDAMGFAPFGQVTDGMSVVDSLYGEYGEGAPEGAGPDQEQINKQGRPYLDKGWPKLDTIKTAVIVGEPAPAAKKKAAAPAAKNP